MNESTTSVAQKARMRLHEIKAQNDTLEIVAIERLFAFEVGI
jgi:hypothetical protein